ncbi:uracil-DNA glycosylase [Hylemonella gracilis]|uniref:Type-4 uracil-DNA glycosylase n=1 Tax=Hylemonella gracilis ATCC 19624 TaxID=887062 RepID=F3KXV7_9BURK|nr:uracil-DNA glycosylase [Hylemonella gracilis]EGI75382.1 putative DNA polymerase-like protein [Hylemonella gracilis ATCC 19624]
MELDARQRAMLEEMGVRVWAPRDAVSAPETAPAPPFQNLPEGSREGQAAPRPAAPRVPPTQVPVPVAMVSDRAAVAPSRDLPADIAAMGWDDLEAAVAGCQACGLCKSRKNTVFGVGQRQARWLIVGEAPGENEDLQGEPFVGQAGKLLDNMLKTLGRSRTSDDEAQSVYIANVLKCRPPGNRNPAPEEVLQCEPYLRRQVALLQPRIILALGRFAVQSLLQHSVPDVATLPLGRLRGQVYRYEGVPVVVSYHPAYLLRTPQDKAKAWDDLCLAQSLMMDSSA